MTLVVDASAVIESLIGTERGRAVEARMMAADSLAAPHVVDLEATNVLRRFERRGELDATAARQAVEDLAIWPAERFGIRLLLPRIWELRHNVSTADACYVALAEALGGVLLTGDIGLVGAAGVTCEIELA